MSSKKTRGFDHTDKQSEEKILQRRNHLLAIAIDGYQYLPRLSNCVRDVEGLIDVLHREYTFE